MAKSQDTRLIYKSLLLYYTQINIIFIICKYIYSSSSKQLELKIKNNTIFKSTNKMKYLGISPTKYTKDLNAENYKTDERN